MVTAAKSQGYIVFTIRKSFWDDAGYADRMAQLEEEGLVTKV